ncbi:MAG: RsiV family protein, partial [Acidimicrobiales bacterium]
SFNFSAETGQLITLESLFLPESDWVNTIGLLTHSALSSQVDQIDPLESWRGWPSATIFEHFAITLNGLQLNFDEYSVAPGYLGGLSVTIAWADLSGLTDPAGPAGPFLIALG